MFSQINFSTYFQLDPSNLIFKYLFYNQFYLFTILIAIKILKLPNVLWCKSLYHPDNFIKVVIMLNYQDFLTILAAQKYYYLLNLVFAVILNFIS